MSDLVKTTDFYHINSLYLELCVPEWFTSNALYYDFWLLHRKHASCECIVPLSFCVQVLLPLSKYSVVLNDYH